MSWCVEVAGFVTDSVGNDVMVCMGDRFCLDNVGNEVMMHGGNRFCI